MTNIVANVLLYLLCLYGIINVVVVVVVVVVVAEHGKRRTIT